MAQAETMELIADGMRSLPIEKDSGGGRGWHASTPESIAPECNKKAHRMRVGFFGSRSSAGRLVELADLAVLRGGLKCALLARLDCRGAREAPEHERRIGAVRLPVGRDMPPEHGKYSSR